MNQTDETGITAPVATSATVERILKKKIEGRMEREHVRTTIESPGWRIFYDRAIAPTLADWKRDLLTRVDLPEDERRSIVRARLVLMDAFFLMYERVYGEAAVERIPEWLKKELRDE
jgi:hypothetical protein